MKKTTNFFYSLILILSGLVLSVPPESHAQQGLSCSQVLVSTENLLFPESIANKVFGKHLQFGFESEYMLNEAAPLLRFYAPDPKIEGNPSENTWKSWNESQRVDYIKSKFGYRPEFAEDTGLILVNHTAPIQLPDKLILDSTGNIEIVFPPVETRAELENIIRTVFQLFGAGSQQSMTTLPLEAFFNNDSSPAENLGFLNFINERDTLEKLFEGHQRAQSRPDSLVTRSFEHPFLGPMNKLKHDQLRIFLERNSQGQGFDDESKRFVRKSDASFKYISGTAYRPDIASPLRVGFEERSSHKDVEGLIGKTRRNSLFLARDRSVFESFASLEAFDTLSTFSSLPENLQSLLKDLFPSKADPRFEYSEAERTSLEVYRNFSYPLRNFQRHVQLLSASNEQRSFQSRVLAARTAYVTSLESVFNQFKAGTIDKERARIVVQQALARFSADSGLHELFESMEQVLLETQNNSSQMRRAE